MSAVAVAKGLFHQRSIGPGQLPPAKNKLLSLDEAAEAKRATQVGGDFGTVSPGQVENTTELLFRISGCGRRSSRAIAAWSQSSR